MELCKKEVFPMAPVNIWLIFLVSVVMYGEEKPSGSRLIGVVRVCTLSI